MLSPRRLAALALVVLTGVVVLASSALGAAPTPKRTSPALRLATKTTVTKGANGVLHYHFVYGPIHIAPGQNSIFLDPNGLDKNARPKQNGYILNFKPNLIYTNGTIPRVDVVHLHHAGWLVNGQPTWAAGEEKTEAKASPGYGWTYKTTDTWTMNHMIHDLT